VVFIAVQYVWTADFGLENGRGKLQYNLTAGRVMALIKYLPPNAKDCYLEAVVIPDHRHYRADEMLTLAASYNFTLFKRDLPQYILMGLPDVPRCANVAG
jgi:hypothetical protein